MPSPPCRVMPRHSPRYVSRSAARILRVGARSARPATPTCCCDLRIPLAADAGLRGDWPVSGNFRLAIARPVLAAYGFSIPPEVLEPIRGHLGIPDGMHDVLVPEVVLQRARVVPVIRELVPAGVAEHVWMDREWDLRRSH